MRNKSERFEKDLLARISQKMTMGIFCGNVDLGTQYYDPAFYTVHVGADGCVGEVAAVQLLKHELT